MHAAALVSAASGLVVQFDVKPQSDDARGAAGQRVDVIACSSAFAAVVAEAADVEMSTVEKLANIEPETVRSMPVTIIVFEPAEETVAVGVPAPRLAPSPVDEIARSSKAVSLIR